MRKTIILLLAVFFTGGCLFDTYEVPQNCPVIHRNYEQPPTLVHGYEEAIENRLQYPELARKAGIEGRVYVSFTVDGKGEVIGTNILRGIGGRCDEEAVRVVSTAEFSPAVKNGRPVCSQDTMRITFRLDN